MIEILNWLVVSTHLKNIGKIGSFPPVGVKIKNIWNHQPVKYCIIYQLLEWRGGPWGPGGPSGFGANLCKCIAHFRRATTRNATMPRLRHWEMEQQGEPFENWWQRKTILSFLGFCCCINDLFWRDEFAVSGLFVPIVDGRNLAPVDN